jgi:hypothetical protein
MQEFACSRAEANMESFLRREGELLKERWTQVIVLLTCLAMILLVTQQGGTIEQQKNLIRVLWDDSKQLTNIRIQELAKKREQMSEEQKKENADPKSKDTKPTPEPPKASPRRVLNDKPMRVLRQI